MSSDRTTDASEEVSHDEQAPQWVTIQVDPARLSHNRRYSDFREVMARGAAHQERLVREVERTIQEGQMAVTDEGIVVEWSVRVRATAYPPLEDWSDEQKDRFSRTVFERARPLFVDVLK